MARKFHVITWCQVLRVLLSCTVFVMYSAMIRIYQDPVAPHDMYPALDTCRHIKDLARYRYDGEYLLRSDIVAQLSMMWSQSNCSRYAGLLTNSHMSAKTPAGEIESREQLALNVTPEEGSHDTQGQAFESANPLDGFLWAAAHHLTLMVDLPCVSPRTINSTHAPIEPAFSSRSEDVPSPPPRARS